MEGIKEEMSDRQKVVFEFLTACISRVAKDEGITCAELFQKVKDNKILYDLMMLFAGILCEHHQKIIEDLLPENIVKLYLHSVKNPVGSFEEKR